MTRRMVEQLRMESMDIRAGESLNFKARYDRTFERESETGSKVTHDSIARTAGT